LILDTSKYVSIILYNFIDLSLNVSSVIRSIIILLLIINAFKQTDKFIGFDEPTRHSQLITVFLGCDLIPYSRMWLAITQGNPLIFPALC